MGWDWERGKRGTRVSPAPGPVLKAQLLFIVGFAVVVSIVMLIASAI